MKYLYLFAFTGICSSLFGIDFFAGTWEEAKAKAKLENKLIFVDAYTTWCGPCKMMSAHVFPDPEVTAFYNKNFINVKLDMEKGEGRDFSRTYRVTAYPTLLYLTSDGVLAHKKIGGCQAEQLIAIGRQVLKKSNNEEELTKLYLASDQHSSSFIVDYLKELNKADKSTAKVANEYIRNRPDLAKDSLAIIAYEGLQDADSRLFDFVLENWDFLKKTYGIENLEQKLLKIYQKSLALALEFDMPSLLDPISKSDKILKTNELERLQRTYYFKEANWHEFEKRMERIDMKDEGDLLFTLSLIDPQFNTWPFEKQELHSLWAKLSEPIIEISPNPSIIKRTLDGLKEFGLEKELNKNIRIIERKLKKEEYGDQQHTVQRILSHFS